jgi:hypothetical protein
MTSYTHYRESKRDQQDHIERHVWGEQKYVKGAGSIIKVRGTDTKDQETAVTVVGSGTSFNLKKDHNAEVYEIAGSADTTLKLAILTIPRDKQRKWKEEHGGIQNPLDNEWALDFGKEKAHVTKKEWAIGKDGEMEIDKQKNVYYRIDKKKHIIDGENIVNVRVKTPQLVQGSEKPPGFQGNEEAEASDDDGGGGNTAAAVYTQSTETTVMPLDPRGLLIGDHSTPIAASMLGSLQFTPRSDLLLGAESKIDLRDGASIQMDGKPLLSAVEARLAALEARIAELEARK